MWAGLPLSQMFSLSFLKHKIEFYWSNRVNDEVFGGGLGLSLTIALLLLSFVINIRSFCRCSLCLVNWYSSCFIRLMKLIVLGCVVNFNFKWKLCLLMMQKKCILA